MRTAVAAGGPPFKTRRKCSIRNWGNGKCFGFRVFFGGVMHKKSQMWAYLLKVKDHLIDIFLNGNCCRPIKIIPEDKCWIMGGRGEGSRKESWETNLSILCMMKGGEMAFLRIHFFRFPFLQIAGICGRGKRCFWASVQFLLFSSAAEARSRAAGKQPEIWKESQIVSKTSQLWWLKPLKLTAPGVREQLRSTF